jgi:uncharacterized protein (DUF433 family)
MTTSRSKRAPATLQKSLRVPRETAQAVEELADASGRDFSATANELLTEAIKSRRCPGVVFADGPSGRRARVAGTGLEVWEIIATHRSVNGSLKRLRRAYHWLTDAQLRAALGYYAAYRNEIDAQIDRNARWSRAELSRRHPSLMPDLA